MASNNMGSLSTSSMDEWGFESPFAQAQDYLGSSVQEDGKVWDSTEQDKLAWDDPAWEIQPSLGSGDFPDQGTNEESEAEATESEDFAGPEGVETFYGRENFDTEAFPSGAVLQTVSGPTGIGQEHWDPNNSGEPLYSTGPGTHSIRLSANFTVKELVTSGGQSAAVARIAPALVLLLQVIRDRAGKPVKITSGYRSWARNKAVYARRNATPTNSRHCSGQAADIKVAGLTGLQLAKLAIDAGGPNLAIGVGADYIHVDVRGSWTIWTYFGKGTAKDQATLAQLRTYREARRHQPVVTSPTFQRQEGGWSAEGGTEQDVDEAAEDLSENGNPEDEPEYAEQGVDEAADDLSENGNPEDEPEYAEEDHEADSASGSASFAPALQLFELQVPEASPGLIAQLRGSLGFVFGAPLRRGTVGDTVTALQTALNRLCFRVIDINNSKSDTNGIFGPVTEQGLKAFQANVGLPRTGIADGVTRQAIIAALSAISVPTSAADLPDAIVRAATGELSRWHKGGRTLQETDGAAIPILRSYWAAVGVYPADRDLRSPSWQNGHPWSAAFISWVMCHAGAGSRFCYSALHYTYVLAAMQNTAKANTESPFWAYSIAEVSPEPGDLVCNARITAPHQKAATLKTLNNHVWKLHCNVVTSTPSHGHIRVVGGNVGVPGGQPALGLTVGERKLPVNPDGKLVPGGRRLLIVRCRGHI